MECSLLTVKAMASYLVHSYCMYCFHTADVFVPLGSESENFTCNHAHDVVYWHINGEDVHQYTTTAASLTQQGFSFYWMSSNAIRMSINATISNNGTEIKCIVRGSVVNTSKVARIIVIGEF